MEKTDVFECKCKKCKHSWIKRSLSDPKMCPKCKSYDWKDKTSLEDDGWDDHIIHNSKGVEW
jgi:predicted Zn-ribbon and HTH transcriptional regulator